MSTAYKARGTVIAHRLGTRISTPSFEGDTSSVPGDGAPFFVTIRVDGGRAGQQEVELPSGLVPPDIGRRVLITVEEVNF